MGTLRRVDLCQYDHAVGKSKKGKGKGASKKKKKPEPKSEDPKDSDESKSSDEQPEDAEPEEAEPEEAEPEDAEPEEAEPELPKAVARGKVNIDKAAPPAAPPGLMGSLHRLDEALGRVEVAAAAFFAIALALVGTYQFIRVTVLKGQLEWADDMIRYLVFFTAMSAAAFAAQQRKMMAIDYLPRKLSPKVRAYTRIIIAVFVVVVCGLLVYAGWLNRASEMKKQLTGSHIIKPSTAMLALPIGTGLIGLHFLFQAILDGSYLLRGKLPPEPEAAAH